jgi:hypothetical protein
MLTTTSDSAGDFPGDALFFEKADSGLDGRLRFSQTLQVQRATSATAEQCRSS